MLQECLLLLYHSDLFEKAGSTYEEGGSHGCECQYVLFCVFTVGCTAVTCQNGASYCLQTEVNKLF
jgi:hypothetical protein